MRVKVSIFLVLLVITFSFGINPIVGKGKAPDFTLVDIDGNEFSLSNQLGKVVIINFFGTDCYYCKLEMPHLRALHDEYPSEQFVIISISVRPWDTNEALRNFVQQYDMEWTVARDTANVAGKYGVSGIPHTVIVDAEGYKRYDHIELTEEATFRSEIDSLLSGKENDDSNTVATELPLELIAIVGAVAVLLVIGIVVIRQKFKWMKPSRNDEGPPKRLFARAYVQSSLTH